MAPEIPGFSRRKDPFFGGGPRALVLDARCGQQAACQRARDTVCRFEAPASATATTARA